MPGLTRRNACKTLVETLGQLSRTMAERPTPVQASCERSETNGTRGFGRCIRMLCGSKVPDVLASGVVRASQEA